MAVNRISRVEEVERALLSKLHELAGPDGRLPTESEIAKMFTVSRTTVRAAVGALVARGLVIRRQGMGSFVIQASRIANPVDEAVDFYHGVIGFDVMGIAKAFRMGFVSAGGYHHHIGLNTWQGEGAPPPPADALGLRLFSVVLPNQMELERVLERVRQAGLPTEQTEAGTLVRDPSQNGVVLTAVA